METYYTYFDHNYLAIGLALYRSLCRHASPFRLYVLCLTEECHAAMARYDLPEVVLIAKKTLCAADAELELAQNNRSPLSFYFTCTPSLSRYIFTVSGAKRITYLDADLYFFSSPKPLFDEIGNAPIAIIEHRFPPRLSSLTVHGGKYNVGWVTFNKSQSACDCIDKWRSDCLRLCPEDVSSESGNGDQKYLDNWPELFPGTHLIQHKGANLAPYNFENYRYHPDSSGELWVNDEPLIFFHFTNLRCAFWRFWSPGLIPFNTRGNAILSKYVFRPYINDVISHTSGDMPLDCIKNHAATPIFSWKIPFRTIKRYLYGQYVFV